MRYIKEYEFREKDADVLVANRALADLFDRVVGQVNTMPRKSVANWIINERVREDTNTEDLVQLLNRVGMGTITASKAKEAIKEQKVSGKARIVLPESVRIISDDRELASIIDDVIAANPSAVVDVKAGKSEALGFLVGQAMFKARGRADPKMVNNLLQQKLNQ